MPTTIQGVTLYNVVEAAQELNVSKNTLHKWIKTGKIKAHKIGKPYYITQESIRQLMGPLFDQKTIEVEVQKISDGETRTIEADVKTISDGERRTIKVHQPKKDK